MVVQGVVTDVLEVVRHVPRRRVVSKGQHHQPQDQGRVDGERQRGPPVAPLSEHH